jgi:hypothetical protein
MTRFILGMTAALVGLTAASAPAQARWSSGLVVAIDRETNSLTLETAGGVQQLLVAPTAIIREDSGATLALADVQPGDAVAYDLLADRAAHLRVARQFWAVPPAR